MVRRFPLFDLRQLRSAFKRTPVYDRCEPNAADSACYVFCVSGILNLLVYCMLVSLIAEKVIRYAVAHELVLALLTSLLICNVRFTRAVPLHAQES